MTLRPSTRPLRPAALASGLAAGVAVAIAAPAARGQETPASQTTLTTYLWAAAVTENLAGGASVEGDSMTVIENLDFGFMGEAIHRRGDLLLGVEGFYVDVSKSGRATLPPAAGEPASPDQLTVGAGLDTTTTFVKPQIGWRLVETPRATVFGTLALRWTRFDTKFGADASDGRSYQISVEDTALDALVGARGEIALTESWSLPFVVGAGAGESDFTWEVFAGLAWTRGPHRLTAGWRHVDWELGSASRYVDSVAYDGPLLAYSFTF